MENSWHWFEKYLTYGNATLPHALFQSYAYEGDEQTLRVARESLDFLLSNALENGYYRPIGQRGWYSQGGTRASFDQQPEDTGVMVAALVQAFHTTRDERYGAIARTVFDWFLGENSSGLSCYIRATGACCDGVTPDGLNLNKGAEATISYIAATLAIASLPSFPSKTQTTLQ
jgi:uncharacterized protein YyaL (SSP411 family)